MTPSDFAGWGALAVSAASFWMSYSRSQRLQGEDRQKLTQLETALRQHASSESVVNLGGRLDELEADVKQVAGALAEVRVVKEMVIGLDRLVTTQLDEIKHSLRRFEERSFDPASPAAPGRRKRPTTT